MTSHINVTMCTMCTESSWMTTSCKASLSILNDANIKLLNNTMVIYIPG